MKGFLPYDIDFTSKQYFFILHALAVMITFYNNDFSSIYRKLEKPMVQARRTLQVLVLC